ncbi:MAG: hypothetical protein H6766_04940 [Candidatus Peribacteria bacterium]|nr:MAG: hypothetical protein H6766_04940 [Candidatus Peribacteria bacterium]
MNFYEQYTKLMTKLLGTTSVKSVAELEASAQSDMSTFIDKQYKRLS